MWINKSRKELLQLEDATILRVLVQDIYSLLVHSLLLQLLVSLGKVRHLCSREIIITIIILNWFPL